MKTYILIYFIALFFSFGCTTNKNFIGSPLKVSSEFVGLWKPTKNCNIPSQPGLSGELSIRSAKGLEFLEIITETQVEPQPFNADFDIEYMDYANLPFSVKGSVEIFLEGRTVSSATVWHPRTEKDKSVGIILKTYELNEKSQLIFHKYGYVSMLEKGKFKVFRYSDMIPNDYRCVYDKMPKTNLKSNIQG